MSHKCSTQMRHNLLVLIVRQVLLVDSYFYQLTILVFYHYSSVVCFKLCLHPVRIHICKHMLSSTSTQCNFSVIRKAKDTTYYIVVICLLCSFCCSCFSDIILGFYLLFNRKQLTVLRNKTLLQHLVVPVIGTCHLDRNVCFLQLNSSVNSFRNQLSKLF